MIQILAKTLVLTVCTSLMACTTLRPVNDWQPPATSTQPSGATSLKPGDHITVTTKDKQKAELDFLALTADALEGTAGKDKQLVKILREKVYRVERKEIDGMKTAGLIGAVALSTFLVIELSGGLSSAVFIPSY